MVRYKKAFWALEVIAKIIIILASFFILTAFMYKLFSALQEESIEQACRASVVTKMNLHDKIENNLIADAVLDENFFPINCKTQDIVVPTDELARRATDEQKKEHLMQQFADDMASCWWMFGNGMFENVLESPTKNAQNCHVCYSIYIKPMLDTEGKPLTFSAIEFKDYLETHAYTPGLLEGGDSLVGSIDTIDFQDQTVTASSRTSRQVTPNRLLASEKHLNDGLADFTDAFAGQEDLKTQIQNDVTTLSGQKVIEQAYIVIPSLAEDVYEERPSLPLELLNDWQVGTPGTHNGMVFIFALNGSDNNGDARTGRLFYATDAGADALFPRALIEHLFDTTAKPYFDQNQPAEGIAAFAKAIHDTILEQGENPKDAYANAGKLIAYQNTYMAYLTGGLSGSKVSTDISSKLTSQGAIIYPKTLETFTPGERYAIIYASQKYSSEALWKDLLILNPASALGTVFALERIYDKNWERTDQIPNMVGVVPHEDLFRGAETLCNIYTEDG